MCGISGIFGYFDVNLVHKMNIAQHHRGPDDEGVFSADALLLGHRRLSIIDLTSGGRQPMCNEDATAWITYNGEIYNFRELRNELERKGHRFRSKSDTEVIIHLYEECAQECLRFLRGMFSFVIWDKKNNKLFAARDRLGEKPFFYHFNNGKFIFSSELRALLTTGLVKKEINCQALKDYFIYGSAQAPDTLIKDVFQLMPAHYLLLEAGRLEIRRYWNIDFAKAARARPESESVSQIRDILEEAVKVRMVSDVPLGVFLSGGIDSSVIACLMHKNSSAPIKTFSVIYKEQAYDEQKYSDMMAQRLKSEHTSILLKDKDLLSLLPQIFNSMDQPSVDGFNTFVISRAVRSKGIKVALSGLGGDELFIGYPFFKTLTRLAKIVKLTHALPKRFRDGLASGLISGSASRRQSKIFFSLLGCRDLMQLHALQRSVFLPSELGDILDIKEGFDVESAYRINLDVAERSLDSINYLSYLEINTYLQNTLLHDTDRMSMANSLEIRVPFLDHLLVEKLFEIPGGQKIGRDYPKRLLVKAMKDSLPREIYNRPKKGFVFPFEDWLRGELKSYCRDKFSCANLKKIPFLNADNISKMYADYSQGLKLHNYSSILAVLAFVNWYEKNILDQ